MKNIAMQALFCYNPPDMQNELLTIRIPAYLSALVSVAASDCYLDNTEFLNLAIQQMLRSAEEQGILPPYSLQDFLAGWKPGCVEYGSDKGRNPWEGVAHV